MLRVLRLKLLGMRDAQNAALLDAVERLFLSQSLSATEDPLAPRLLPARSETRARAAAALAGPPAPGARGRVEEICASILRDPRYADRPGAWFDAQAACLEYGSDAAFDAPDRPCHRAAGVLLDLCSFFAGDRPPPGDPP